MPSRLESLSRLYGPETWDIYDVLDRSLEPRGREWLHELAADYLTAGARILDAGCRDASDLIRLVQAHDGFGVGVDPVAIHVERARAAVAAASLDERIEIVDGVMETLAYADCSFDFVWCRDVLEGVEPLDDALRALAKMLKRDGRMLVYTSFATDLLTGEEQRLLERLRRSRERLERELPVELLNHIEATLHWELFLFLGKLQPTVYVLTHS